MRLVGVFARESVITNVFNYDEKIGFHSAARVLRSSMGTAQRRMPAGFIVVKENAVTAVKDQHRNGTCWDFATLPFFESEILRKSGHTIDLCEMFVVNKDYMDCAEHYVRMHGFFQITEGGSEDDVLDVLRRHGICPEGAIRAAVSRPKG